MRAYSNDIAYLNNTAHTNDIAHANDTAYSNNTAYSKRENLLNGELDEVGDEGDPESGRRDEEDLDERSPALKILTDHQRRRISSHPDSDA